ncbi:MAG: PAS domain-containing protein [Chloroflexota bacterium]|nr:PAS domain-containing protein [Chloroflexota bacterium]
MKINLAELGTLFGGLRAAVTVTDETYHIVFMNDLASEHYATRGGAALIGTNLLDCHNTRSQAQLREMYARYHGGDLTPTRHHVDEGDGRGKSTVFIPLMVKGKFRGVAEMIWSECSELVFEK